MKYTSHKIYFVTPIDTLSRFLFMYGVSHEGKYCTFNKILVRKAQISVESYLVYQSVSQSKFYVMCIS
jgi:hypothetical protein